MPKRILHLILLVLGFLGVVSCVAAIVAVWIVAARVEHATKHAFNAIDESLAGIQQRIPPMQERVRASRITVKDIEQQIQLWAMMEAQDQLVSRLGIEEKAQRLASSLEQIDQWLELTESSVRLVYQSLEAGNLLGLSVETSPAYHLIDELATLRSHLTEATDIAQRIEERAAGDSLRQEGAKEIIQLALRVVATLGSIETRLETFKERLGELQTRAQQGEAAAMWWVNIVAISLTLLCLWMAAGQGALGYLGWSHLRRGHSNKA